MPSYRRGLGISRSRPTSKFGFATLLTAQTLIKGLPRLPASAKTAKDGEPIVGSRASASLPPPQEGGVGTRLADDTVAKILRDEGSWRGQRERERERERESRNSSCSRLLI